MPSRKAAACEEAEYINCQEHLRRNTWGEQVCEALWISFIYCLVAGKGAHGSLQMVLCTQSLIDSSRDAIPMTIITTCSWLPQKVSGYFRRLYCWLGCR